MTTAVFLVLDAILTCAQTGNGGSALPAAIAGTWDVSQVAVDREDALHWRFRPDDPQLVGRTLVIDPGKVQFDFSKDLSCKQTAWHPKPTTWGALLAKGFPRPTDGGRSAAPSPDDFGIKVGKKSPVTAYPVCPLAGKGAAHFPSAPWVALQAPDALALNLDNQVLLIFQRRQAGAKPASSFDCTKPTTPTEKAICGNFNLASWDRSVAAAFRQALERRPEKAATLRQSHKDWLQKRNSCGSSEECIDELQWRHVEELTQE